jgi:GGDEF domain-containing protein
MGLEWDHRNVHFDLVSSLISTGALAAMMGIWMLLASRVRDEPNAPELRIWGFSCLLFGVAYVLFSARGSIDLVLSMVLGNVLFAVAYCGFGWAIARLFRRPYPFAVVGISVTAASLALYVTEIVIATTQWRTLVLVVITIVPWIVSYLQCSRHWRAQRLPSVMAMRIFFAAVILVSVTRTAASVISGSFGYEGLPTGPGFLLGTFILLISPILLTVGFFVLCAEQAQEVIRQMANTDALTGILNRRSVLAEAERRLATARRHGRELACVIFDLDRFKTVNDRFGHAAGDLAIVGVARTLTPTMRVEDVFGRLGGDEFVLFLPTRESTAPAGSPSVSAPPSHRRRRPARVARSRSRLRSGSPPSPQRTTPHRTSSSGPTVRCMPPRLPVAMRFARPLATTTPRMPFRPRHRSASRLPDPPDTLPPPRLLHTGFESPALRSIHRWTDLEEICVL